MPRSLSKPNHTRAFKAFGCGFDPSHAQDDSYANIYETRHSANTKEKKRKNPIGQRPCPTGSFLSKKQGENKGECVAYSGASFLNKRVIQGRQSCMRFAKERVKLIRKIWFREVLDISNNEIIIIDFRLSVKR